MDQLINQFEDIQSQIEELEDDPVSHEEERKYFEDAFFDSLATAKKLLIDSQPVISPVQVAPQIATKSLKLPPIDLPVFDGSMSLWMKFHNTFTDLVHNDMSLSNIQKFHHLQSCLKGDALAAIAAIKISDLNYTLAYKTLCDRYSNTRIIVNSHIENIFQIPTIKKECKNALRNLLDGIKNNLSALENLNQPVDQWGALINFIIASKLDTATRDKWEDSLDDSTVLPTYDKFVKFLTQRCHALEMKEIGTKLEDTNLTGKSNKNKNTYLSNQSNHGAINKKLPCNFCKGNHMIYYCRDFLKLSEHERYKEIKTKQLCCKCLRSGHSIKECKGEDCRICKKPHNTLLHFEKSNNNLQNEEKSAKIENAVEPKVGGTTAMFSGSDTNYIILSTAVVTIFDNHGNGLACRALLDSGSQSNYMTSAFAEKLNLYKKEVNIPVRGIGKNIIKIKFSARARIHSSDNKYSQDLNFLIINKITDELPNIKINVKDLKIPPNIKLADEKFFEPQKIDVLLGSGIFWSLLRLGQICLGSGMPILQKTALGWMVCGPTTISNANLSTVCNFSTNKDLSDQIEQFWKVEEFSAPSKLSKEEEECELHFKKHTTRDSDGRFVVSLPFKENINSLGDSRESALKQFYRMENRLKNNVPMKIEYHKFLNEYLTLGHMSLVDENSSTGAYFMPHHPVIKASSTTTKCRVVFNASHKTTSQLSLNDTIKKGPVIQEDLFSILCRFRCHNYVIIADIEKMYRMVMVNKSDCKYQHIWWRFNQNEPVQEYELNTLTYGTVPASFLSTRCLHQVAYTKKDLYPKEAEIILKDFYVDDLISGADTANEAKTLKNNIIKILSEYGLNLRK